jgi:hypothetical protein
MQATGPLFYRRFKKKQNLFLAGPTGGFGQ